MPRSAFFRGIFFRGRRGKAKRRYHTCCHSTREEVHSVFTVQVFGVECVVGGIDAERGAWGISVGDLPGGAAQRAGDDVAAECCECLVARDEFACVKRGQW